MEEVWEFQIENSRFILDIELNRKYIDVYIVTTVYNNI